jgi:hypothetical protein
MSVQWIAILRDALAIVVARSLARGLLDAFGAGDGAMGAVDLAVRVAAFCAIGCASPARRFTRLGLTAACTWAIMLIVGLVRGAAAAYGLDFLATLLAMLLGGAASLAIVRPGRGGAAAAAGSPAVGEDPKLPPG